MKILDVFRTDGDYVFLSETTNVKIGERIEYGGFYFYVNKIVNSDRRNRIAIHTSLKKKSSGKSNNSESAMQDHSLYTNLYV